MTYPIAPPAESLLRPRQSLTLARLWWLRRQDNFSLRLTDHDHELTGPDGFTYTPIGAFEPTAVRKSSGLEEQNADLRGVLSSDAITYDDLRARRYEEAEINEYVVDFRFPWAGTMQHTRYWITETRFDGEQWHAQVSGIPYWFRFSVGGTYTRGCTYDVFGPGCDLDPTPFQQTGDITVILEQHLEFEINIVGTSDNYFDDGECLWLTGANQGVLSQVRTYHNLSPRKVRLFLRTPFAVVVGDTALFTPGCDKTGATCKTKYSNLVNFGGKEFMPGTDELIKTAAS